MPKTIVYQIKNILGQPVTTLESNIDQEMLGKMLAKFDWCDRFMKYVAPRNEETGCLLWVGSKLPKGYGIFWHKEHKYSVGCHRLIYLSLKGEAPDCVMHICNNPNCVNPDHLKAGSTSENLKYRSLCGGFHVEKNPNTKLTREQVIEIKSLIIKGMPQKEIAKKFNISQASVSNIKHGKVRIFG